MKNKKVVLTESQLRRLLMQLIKEEVDGYVANTDGDVHKDDHADPTAKDWDAGLDESEEDHGDDHTKDPRWEQHADPTGREWNTGLEEDTLPDLD